MDTFLPMTTKEKRIDQWNSKTGLARGWDRWRCSTFLEMISAKIDRAIIAADKVTHFTLFCKEDLPEKQRIYDDYIDSLEDAANYLEKLREISKNISYVSNHKMP
ncbi:MAG: hypothetical protein ACRC78_17955 [Planktothrix sp.]